MQLANDAAAGLCALEAYGPLLIIVASTVPGGVLPVLPRGQGTILVVEDQESVARLTERVLTNVGNEVLVATRPQEALALFQREAADIDLLLTDPVMPAM